MPTYKVYEVQEEVVIRKRLYEVEADCEVDAIEKAMNREAEAIEHDVISEPEFVTQGFAARTIADADEMAWQEALTDLADRRQI